MRKKFLILVMMIASLLLSGCCLSHEWQTATCTEPETCIRCGKTQGEPLGHEWTNATCTTPKICRHCGQTDGEPTGHEANAVTCTEDSVCSVCGEIIEKATGHEWKEATVRAPKTCKNCGITEGVPLEVQYFDMSFSDYKKNYNEKYSGYREIENTGSGFKLRLDGMPNYLILFNLDEFDMKQQTSAYSSIEQEKFNKLTLRFFSNDSTVNKKLLSVMCVLAGECAEVLDPDFSTEDFAQNMDISIPDDVSFATIDYSNGNININVTYYKGTTYKETTTYFYDANITLSGNH